MYLKTANEKLSFRVPDLTKFVVISIADSRHQKVTGGEKMRKILLAIAVLSLLPTCAFAARGFFPQLGEKLVDNIVGGETKPEENTQGAGQGEWSEAVKMQRGTISLACGCNGNVNIGASRKNDQCASGVEQAVLCNGRCKNGRQWAAVCQ